MLDIIENLIGHLEYYLSRSINFWVIAFIIYLFITIILREAKSWHF